MVFVGAQEKVGLSFVRGVISDVHAAGNDGFNFIPAAAAAGTPCGRAFSTSWGRASGAYAPEALPLRKEEREKENA